MMTPFEYAEQQFANALQHIDGGSKESRQYFTEHGLPGKQDEAWRYVPWTWFQNHNVQRQSSTNIMPDTFDACRPHWVFMNGCLADSHLDHIPVSMTLDCESPSQYLDGLEAWIDVAAVTRLCIEVPANTHIEQPLIWWHQYAPTDPIAVSPLLVEWHLGENSQVTLLEYHQGESVSHCHFASHRIHLAKGAKLEHGLLHEHASEAWSTSSYHVDCHKAAQYHQHNYQLGGSVNRTHTYINLVEPQAHADCHGLLVAHDSNYVDQHITLHHRSPHCTSNQTIRGLIGDQAVGTFNGRVVIAPQAQHSQADQSNKNLLLSPHARINTKPELEIYADDVRCSHGATVGQLDEDALFYMRSRGIAPTEARQLLINAFVHDILDHCPIDLIRRQVRQSLLLFERPAHGT